ncbi:Crp/Fnr family transcriptional regulator [Tsuneonella amylolytica]|uniref:Crp/Fnr family transcriptional regulator n=1 Tax=Tsuneonella amylolytica TaxID=2338327 RepID=UPI0013C44882|nr:Crp/Fnr family transcriptional regulator [Tsuneonella amylolytica]
MTNDGAEGVLETRIGRHINLTYSERDALRWLERRERRFEAGEIVVREGDFADCLHIVAAGWLHGSNDLPAGARQILRFYFKGDIVTTSAIVWGYSSATLTAVSACRLYELPRDALARLFRDFPRLAAVLYGISAAEQVAMADRVASLGRTDGLTRVATLLLDIRSRLRLIDGAPNTAFELPLTQQDLGDAVGLTKTHVNRTLRQMEADGWIEREGRLIRLLDADALAQRIEFKDRHIIAIDWLPPVKMALENVT